MRVAVEKELHLGWREARWNVDEMDAEAFEIEIERQWPASVTVAISAHNAQRASRPLDQVFDLRPANIAEMPDFIRIGERVKDV
jgi:hypothetical protein